MKETFKTLLRNSGRLTEEQFEAVIGHLDSLGFFKAPASAKRHLAVEGGLCQHSINVCNAAINLHKMLSGMIPTFAEQVPLGNLMFAALMHDICKAEIYTVEMRNVKDAVGNWVKEPYYKVDCSKNPYGHGQKSVIRLLRWGIPLTDDETLAILWHMGEWDVALQSYESLNNLSAAADKCPMVTTLQLADRAAAQLMERA